MKHPDREVEPLYCETHPDSEVGPPNSDSVYFSEVHKFSAWCKENYLDLNIVKTKEMIVDFRKKPTSARTYHR